MIFMHIQTLSILPIIMISCFLPFRVSADIVISHIQIEGKTANDEYVDITNTGVIPVALTHYALKKKHVDSHGACPSLDSLVSDRTKAKFPPLIGAGVTFRIAHPAYSGSVPADVTYAVSTTLVNDTTILLFDGIRPDPIDSKTIGKPCPPEPEPVPPPTPVMTASTLRLNELLPNPDENESLDEYIELYNYGSETINLKDWMLHDASQTGKYVFKEDTSIKPGDFFMIYRATFAFALNNDKETVTLLNPLGATIDSVTYDSAAAGVSYNNTGTTWRWSRTLTPGSTNHLNTLPDSETSVPDEAYAGVAEDFSAESRDVDGDSVKYTWDFGDGHKSYRQATTHAYEDTGTYTVMLRIDDGSETDTQTFTVKVEKYPRPKVRITAVMPNPSGKDTGNEYVEVKNLSKKSVRLKGWKIATKTSKGKRFTNHVILSRITLKPGASRRITAADSRFVLNNTSLKIALRTPDGHTAQTIGYSLKKPASENDLYARLPDTSIPVPAKLSAKNKKLAKREPKIPTSWQWIAAEPVTRPAPLTPIQSVSLETVASVEAVPIPSTGSLSLDPSRQTTDLSSLLLLPYPRRILGIPQEQFPVPVTTRPRYETAEPFSGIIGSFESWFIILFH